MVKIIKEKNYLIAEVDITRVQGMRSGSFYRKGKGGRKRMIKRKREKREGRERRGERERKEIKSICNFHIRRDCSYF